MGLTAKLKCNQLVLSPPAGFRGRWTCVCGQREQSCLRERRQFKDNTHLLFWGPQMLQADLLLYL